MPHLTRMEVDDKQARFFLLLSKAGAWDIVDGSVLIHIDSLGNPVKAETRQFVSLSTARSIDLQVVV